MRVDLDRCRIECAMRNVRSFLDSLTFGDVKLDKPMEEGDNYFFGCIEPRLETSSTMCETDRGCDDLHIHGKMDLYANGVIIDYKTGKAKSGKDIVTAMDYGDPSERPDFQPLVYLALGKQSDISKGEFDLFYAMDNDSESGAGPYDVRRNIRRVYLTDEDDMDFLNDERVIRAIDKNLNSRVSFRKDIDLFVQCISSSVNGPASTWPDQIDAIVGSVMRAFKSKEETTVKAVNVVLNIMQRGIAGGETEVVVRMQALDSFLNEVNRVYSKIKAMAEDEFLPTPCIECEKCDYFSVCTAEVINFSEEGNIGD